VDYTLSNETHRIRFQMREHRFIDLDHPIPLYIAGFGPKAQALAGELGDGLVSGMPRGGTVPEMLANARRGAIKAGRALPKDFHTAAMVNVALRQPGEAANSERIIAECGAAVISGLHYLVAQHLETGAEPPAYARPVWKGYLEWLNEAPPEVRHQRLHGSHYSFVDPEEARFLTPELIEATLREATARDLGRLVNSATYASSVLYNGLGRHDAGYDWGGRAACVAAAMWPQRCTGLVSVNGYLIQDISAAVNPLRPELEAGFWYFFYSGPSRGGLACAAGDPGADPGRRASHGRAADHAGAVGVPGLRLPSGRRSRLRREQAPGETSPDGPARPGRGTDGD